jgi:hypothetical protein
MKKFCYLWVLLAFPISGCLEMDIKEIRVDVPINEFEHACTVGNLGGIEISCEKLMAKNTGTPTGRLYLPGTTSSSNPMVECEDQKCHLLVPGGTMDSISAKPALIVALEPGTYQANLTVPDSGVTEFYKQLAEPSDPMMAKVVKPLIPHLRVVVFNLVKAALEQTFLASNTKKYSRIYVVVETAESSTKNLFLQTIDKATHLHPKVDLFILGHGYRGSWTFSPTFEEGTNNKLTSSELIEFGTSLGETRQNKIRSIFTTHCFQAAKTTSGGESMANALALAFPSSRSYGSIEINYYGFHRDLLAFDRYYQDDNPNEATRFSTAVAWGARAIEMNLATGNSRSTIAFPKIKIKGEGEPARGPGWLRKRLRKTQIQEAPIPPYPAKFDNKVASYPFIFEGAKLSGQNVQVTPVSTPSGTLLSYIPYVKWPTVKEPQILPSPKVPGGWLFSPAELLPATSPIRQNLTVYQQQEADRRVTEAAKTSLENNPPTTNSENLSSYAPAKDCSYKGEKILDGSSQLLSLGPDKTDRLLECKEGSISLREPATSSSVTPQVPSSAK